MRWLGGGNLGLIHVKGTVLRYFSRKRAENLRKINPRVPFPDAASIAQSLYQIVKDHGPLTVSNAWNHAKEANVCGLNSKTHMKIMLKWMRGRKALKLLCNHIGSNKKFLYCALTDERRTDQRKTPSELNLQTEKTINEGKNSTQVKTC
ncbi:hypothetical protein K2173_010359 [Erythroxylum novogranatense]|uniref:Uncharacterized protein n=1 Tax=Erythroxylum novogranatense TaxID=1862640 RepID=A0AAV8TFZ7_9ROSI|nr:hypothetical protein K2173_010359 [Erythroxylum novogranatense]